MNIKPLRDRVLLELPTPEEKVGSIFIPDESKAGAERGIVKEIGENVTEVKVGEEVMFMQYNKGTLLKFEGKEYMLIGEEELLGTYTEAK
jgi:chaperonin GroES